MSNSSKEGFVKPPVHLRTRKLQQTARAPSVDEAVKRAESRIAEIVKNQPNWADEDMKRLTDACLKAENDGANRAAHMDDLYASAHDLKGMGGNFGYPIVTDITSLLCKYVGEHPQPDLRVVALYVNALRMVFDHNLDGDGGAEGRLLVERLNKLGGKIMPDASLR